MAEVVLFHHALGLTPGVETFAELLRAVRAVVAGDALLSPRVTRRLIEEFASRAKEPRPTAAVDVLTDRERFSPGRTGAALLWAIARAAPESLVVRAAAWDDRFGRPRMREALLRGDDPDSVVRADSAAVSAFLHKVAPFELYR